MAAQYCNWLHNDRSSDLSAIEDGAYDASTFSTNSDGTFNDQLTRHPDARYWIPSLDEWVKAAHYDPDRFGEGQGGWWDYPDGSDDPLYPGFPGEGETSATLDWDGAYLPLGAYADIQSPWGLFDLSGGTMEWTEEVHHSGKFRLTDGAPVFGFESFLVLDAVNEIAATDGPGSQSRLLGFRVAGAIPTPSSIALLVCAAGLCLQLARRRS
jgi:formylglycine-generating enzyme required for sulfatase activity